VSSQLAAASPTPCSPPVGYKHTLKLSSSTMKQDATTAQSYIGDKMSSAARKIVGRTLNFTVYLMLVDQL